MTKSQIHGLFADFAKSLASLHNPVEAANFIRDLLSEQEVVMLARRLQIARFLQNGLTYAQIKKAMKASETTVAKVQTWLKFYGEGYRMVLSRTKSTGSKSDFESPWNLVKRKHPIYFWPELLLREIVKSANKREKQRLLTVINQMKEKTKLSKELLKLLG